MTAEKAGVEWKKRILVKSREEAHQILRMRPEGEQDFHIEDVDQHVFGKRAEVRLISKSKSY